MLHFAKIPKKMVKFGENSATFGKLCEILEKNSKNSAIFNENFEIRERFPNHCSSNEHSTHNAKERTKRKLTRPQHLHSLLSRFSLQPPFIEVLSGLLRAAYWPLVF